MSRTVTISYDEYLKTVNKKATFLIDGEEVNLPIDPIFIDSPMKEIELPLKLAVEKGLA